MKNKLIVGSPFFLKKQCDLGKFLSSLGSEIPVWELKGYFTVSKNAKNQ